jgi:Right handed beta helix region
VSLFSWVLPHIYNIFEGVTADGGAIYFSTGGTTYTPGGNQILNNKIHDLSDDSVMDSDGYGGSGIYLDSYTGLLNIQNNLIYRTSGDGVKITKGPQLAGQANTVKNNIVAYSRLGGILNNTPYVGTTCPVTVPTIFNATANLFYFDRQSTSTPAYFLQQGCDYTCGASITTLHNWQNNLYWRIGGTFEDDTKAFHTQSKPGTSALCTLGTNTWTFYTFSAWQGLGEDLSSSTNINPGFNAPAYPTDDYSLPKGSPNSFFTVFDPTQAGRSNPVIKSTNPLDILPTFPTSTYNPATDY